MYIVDQPIQDAIGQCRITGGQRRVPRLQLACRSVPAGQFRLRNYAPGAPEGGAVSFTTSIRLSRASDTGGEFGCLAHEAGERRVPGSCPRYAG
jgi:hypothetical protein